MSVLLDKLIAKKEYWTQIGFTYGPVSYTHLTLPTT